LDILVGIPDPLEVAPLREALEPIGYEHATWAGVPGHEVFGKGDPRTHIVHVVPLGGPAWKRSSASAIACAAMPRLHLSMEV
jgi:hypothetical protein